MPLSLKRRRSIAQDTTSNQDRYQRHQNIDHSMAYATPTALLPRQVNVIIGSNPSATISSLSSALVTASSNIATLSQQSQQLSQQSQQLSQSVQQLSQSTQVLSQSIQQLQIRSAQDVQNIRNSAAIAMASMASSANAAIATASNNAAVALASISGSLAAVASAARQSALAEQANASAVRAQAQTQVMTAQGNAIGVTQTTIAIVASIAGTFILSLVGFLFFLRSRNRQQRRRIAELKGTIKRPLSPTGSSNMVWDNKGWNQRSEKEQQEERSTGRSPDIQPMIGVATSSQFGREEKRSSNWPLSSSASVNAQKSNRQSSMDPSNITIVKVGQAEGGAAANEPSQQQGTGTGSSKAPNLSLFPKITESTPKKDTQGQGKEGSNTRQANVNTQYPPRYSVEPERGTVRSNVM